MKPFYLVFWVITAATSFLLMGCDDDKSALEETREGMDNVAEKVVDGTKDGLAAAGAGVEKAAEVTGEVITGTADAVKDAVEDE